jgi:hypothetical protein
VSLRRDPNVMIGGTVYALTAILAVRPGRERLLRGRVRAWGSPVSPFAVLGSTHFARLVVLDRLAFEGPAVSQPEISHQYLLFSSTFDGAGPEDRDAYLEDMCSRLPARVESVFGLCVGAPSPLAGNPVPFRDWIVANQVKTRAFFAHRPKATVGDVRAARALRERVREFALRTQYQRPDVLQANFERVFPRA